MVGYTQKNLIFPTSYRYCLFIFYSRMPEWSYLQCWGGKNGRNAYISRIKLHSPLQCGKPMQKSICRVCGCAIGGHDHTLLKSNKKARKWVHVPYISPYSSITFLFCFAVLIVLKQDTVWAITLCEDKLRHQNDHSLQQPAVFYVPSCMQFFFGLAVTTSLTQGI